MKIRYYYDSLYPVYFLDQESLHPDQVIEVSPELLSRYSKALEEFNKVQAEIIEVIKAQRD